MSRTYKDKPDSIRFKRYYLRDEEDKWNKIPFIYEYTSPYTGEQKSVIRYIWLEKPGVRQKLKKRDDLQWNWMYSTPSWWTRMMMNRPQRREGRVWERKVLFQDLEEVDPPGVGRKPHKYYY